MLVKQKLVLFILPIKRRHNMKELRSVLNEYYIDYRNNYLTPEKFAEHNGLTEIQALILLAWMKEIFYSDHPEA